MHCPDCGVELEEGSLVCPHCATQIAPEPRTLRTPPPSNERIAPGSLPGYDIESVLGEGGMGVVFLARERALDRRVAIKFMTEHDRSAGERFLREARLAATIEHPHVVRIYGYGESSGRPYIAMQYIEGETLARRIQRRGALPIEQALRITRQTAEALRAAWEKNVVHRDVKPSNILLDPRGQAHLADFGLAKPFFGGDSSITATGSFVGTPYYISPEQAEGNPVDFRGDIYSLGIILYEMLTGERPFEGNTPVAIVAKHLHEPLPSPRRLRPEIPREVDALLVEAAAVLAEHQEPLTAFINSFRQRIEICLTERFFVEVANDERVILAARKIRPQIDRPAVARAAVDVAARLLPLRGSVRAHRNSSCRTSRVSGTSSPIFVARTCC